MAKTTENLADRLAKADFPQNHNGRSWDRNSIAFKRVCRYAKQLQDMGMSDERIEFMFRDLYWDAFFEFNIKETTPTPVTRRTVLPSRTATMLNVLAAE